MIHFLPLLLLKIIRKFTEINTIKANKYLLEFRREQPPNVKELRSGTIQVEVSSLQ